MPIPVQNPYDQSDESFDLDPSFSLGFSLDWDAYFEEFKAQHGGDPVRFKGRLLFQDGWTYSGRDKAGPEWPPPTKQEELDRLKVSYWLTRLRIVQTEYNWLHETLYQLEQLQRIRSIPLMQSLISLDEATGQHRRESKPLDLDAQKSRLDWLAQDILDCQTELRRLK